MLFTSFFLLFIKIKKIEKKKEIDDRDYQLVFKTRGAI
jgi:hypothetical protein